MANEAENNKSAENPGNKPGDVPGTNEPGYGYRGTEQGWSPYSSHGRSEYPWQPSRGEYPGQDWGREGNQSAYYGQGNTFGHNGNYGQNTGYGSRPLGASAYGASGIGGYGHDGPHATDNSGDHGSDYGESASSYRNNQQGGYRYGGAQFGRGNEGSYGPGSRSGLGANYGSASSYGPHRGKGPKGYRRTDERIMEDVSDRLMDDAHIDASEIEVQVANNEVILTGTVENRFAKRHAEEIAEHVSGVRNVENRLRVKEGRGK